MLTNTQALQQQKNKQKKSSFYEEKSLVGLTARVIKLETILKVGAQLGHEK